MDLTAIAFYADMAPWAKATTGLLLLALLALVLRFAVHLTLMHFVRVWRSAMPASGWAPILMHDHVLSRMAKIVPSLVFQLGTRWVQELPQDVSVGIVNVATALTVFHVVRVLATLLEEINEAHDRHDGPKITQTNSIKSYVQLGKLIAYIVGALLITASLLNRSPLLLLSGLGAMSAVLMLVFKDTILSFVAGVQIASNDMLRVGDWIEMPQVGADGFVVDIALNTVKVQNWDKTIVSVPTWRLMSESFKNWRGMQQSGGRRIKRSLYLDASQVRFLDEAEAQKLSGVRLLTDYLRRKQDELSEWNQANAGNVPLSANRRRLTNIGTFRAYAEAYLKAHPDIHPHMTCMVRQLQPGAEGVPLEIYCFTRTTAWLDYERIQGDIFDYLMAVLPEFGLGVYQQPSGQDLRGGLQGLLPTPAARSERHPALDMEQA